MGFSKKTGKGRLDKYYFLAKDQGYRARSAFKLVQLHKKYNLLDQARVVIDLCAAPGGWLQVAAKFMPVSHVIVGVDLVPIKPIPGVKTIVADITTDKCRSELKKELKAWKADVVLHDGAPNVGSAWIHDAYSQAELVLHSLKLATEFLTKDGTFVSKVFRSKDYNSLLWVFNQLFSKVEATKPASSRDVSAEIFVVCRGFKAPSHIDPRLLDPKHVFEDLALLQSAGKTDLAHPEKHTRHRGGYEDGATLLFKTMKIIDFIHSVEPNTVLSTHNALTFDDDTPLKVKELSAAIPELKEICKDLKVLGRREFKILSRWRKTAREALGLSSTSSATVIEDALANSAETPALEENPLDILDELSKRNLKLGKKEKRKALERKAKQRMRMQLSMGNADDLADEYAQNEPLFSLSKKSSGAILGNDHISMGLSSSESDKDDNKDTPINEPDIDTLSENSDEANWESDLEHDYDQQTAKMIAKNPVELVKSKRKEKSVLDHPNSDDNVTNEVDSDVDASANEDGSNGLVVSLVTKDEEKQDKSAKMAFWYSNPLFNELETADQNLPKPLTQMKLEKKRTLSERTIAMEDAPASKGRSNASKKMKNEKVPGEIIFVKAEPEVKDDEEFDEASKSSIMSASGMTLAAKLAKDRVRATKDLIDESFNRYSFQDDTPLPRWFLDEESKHNKPQKPITKEGIALLKAKLREIDSRPIKKELEAKGRNRQRMMKKLDAMKKKAAVIADTEDMGEKQKGEQIQKLLSKATKPQKKEVKLVIAKGDNKGLKGRPKGVKGHYKMVDSRMKKEVRALKRIKNRKTTNRKRN